eukprot:12887694-Prorocentrum_lima.AAC.1
MRLIPSVKATYKGIPLQPQEPKARDMDGQMDNTVKASTRRGSHAELVAREPSKASLTREIAREE